jgi:hypothetical protein
VDWEVSVKWRQALARVQPLRQSAALAREGKWVLGETLHLLVALVERVYLWVAGRS